MGYRFLRLQGDGDCYFHGVALHLKLIQEPFTPALGKTYADAGMVQVVRWELASLAAEELFRFPNGHPWHGRNALEVLNAEIANAKTAEEVTAVVSQLPEPDFGGHVSTVALESALPPALSNRWKSAGDRKKLVAFFLYWYQKTSPACQEKGWGEKAALFGYGECKYCIYGDLSVNIDGDARDSGFASHLVFRKYALVLAGVHRWGSQRNENSLAHLELCAWDESRRFLVHSGIHFDAAIWVDEPELNNQVYVLEGLVGNEEKAKAMSASRYERNSHRSGLVLGVAVWNINHLSVPTAKKKQQTKAPRKTNEKPETPKWKLKVNAIEELQRLNAGWLDVLTLNEVNSMVPLRGLTQWTAYAGPHLQSVTANGGEFVTGQNEYYPLLLPKTAREGLTVERRGCFYVGSGGEVKEVADGQLVQWTKPKNRPALEEYVSSERLAKPVQSAEGEEEEGRRSKRQLEKRAKAEGREPAKKEEEEPFPYLTYRPVVVHRLLINEGTPGELQVNVGVLHTTPAGTEFERWLVYWQLSELFAAIPEGDVDMPLKAEIPVHWIVLGDFYLFAESRVRLASDPYRATQEKIEELYREEWAYYEELLQAETENAAYYREIKDLTARAATLIRTHELGPVLRWSSNGAMEDPAKHFEELSTACGAAKAARSAPKEVAKPTHGALRGLALAVDKVLQARLPYDNARGWLDWLLMAIPSSLYHGYCGAHRSKVVQVVMSAERRKAVENAFEDLEGFCEYLKMPIARGRRLERRNWLARCGEVLTEWRWLVDGLEYWETIERDANPEKEREAYEAPVKAFEKNRDKSTSWLERYRNVLGQSFESQLTKDFHVLQSIWGTNIHGAAVVDPEGANPRVEYASFRIADFVVCSKSWRTCEIGVFHHAKQGVLRVDDKAVRSTVHWRKLSDHFPIGGRFSLGLHDQRVQRVFVEEEDADYVAARNVLYMRDVLRGLYGVLDEEAEERVAEELKGLAKQWPERKARDGKSSAESNQMEVEKEGELDFEGVFATHRDAVVARLLKLQMMDLAGMVDTLTVTSQETFAVLCGVVEAYRQDGRMVPKELTKSGLWAVEEEEKKDKEGKPEGKTEAEMIEEEQGAVQGEVRNVDGEGKEGKDGKFEEKAEADMIEEDGEPTNRAPVFGARGQENVVRTMFPEYGLLEEGTEFEMWADEFEPYVAFDLEDGADGSEGEVGMEEEPQ